MLKVRLIQLFNKRLTLCELSIVERNRGIIGELV
jgi:hypothetical protein